MDLYIVLGVRRSASAEDIRRAYRRLARRFHPDINPGDGEAAARFRDILSAYETLVDPERRRRYDHGEPPPAAPRLPPASPASTSPRVSTPSARRPSVISSAAPCSPPVAPGRPQRGADLHVTLTVPLAAIVAPSRHTIAWSRDAACGTCAGSGDGRGTPAECVACGGSGSLRRRPRPHGVHHHLHDLWRAAAGSRRRGARRVTAAG